jgi:hypothetical protein
VFSISDELVLPNFRSIFRRDLDDPALSNAAMLTFAFAVDRVVSPPELLAYHSQTLKSIRTRMGTPDEAASESTLAAILLLAGVEVSTLFSYYKLQSEPHHLRVLN